MAKIDILFNDENYTIDEAQLAEATSALKNHLATVMNGTGATIILDGTTYNVDSVKLTAATNDFVSYLGTISGTGSKITVNGVEYSIDTEKLDDAINELHTVLSNMQTNGEVLNDYGFYYNRKYSLYNTEYKALPEGELGLYFRDNQTVDMYVNGVLFDTFDATYEKGTITVPVLAVFDVISTGSELSCPLGVLKLGDARIIDGDYIYTYIDLGEYRGWTANVSDITKSSYSFIRSEIDEYPVIILGETFKNCINLTVAPEIPSSVVWMIGTFCGCTRLIEAPVIPNSVVNMDGAFKGCTRLTEAPVIPNGVINMDEAFEGCTSLTGNIEIHANPTNYSHCFYDTELPIHITGSCSLATKEALAATANNKNVTFDAEEAPEGLNEYGFYYNAEYSAYNTGGNGFPEGDIGVLCRENNTADMYVNGALYQTFPVEYSENTIVVPALGLTFTVVTGGTIVACDLGAFRIGGTSLVNGDYRYILATDNDRYYWSVGVIDNTKSSYGEIKENIEGLQVKALSETFKDCTNLTTIPSIPSSISIMLGMFENCASLTTAPVINENVNVMNYLFRGCTSLTGNVEINANPSYYSNCFADTVLPITITGSCPEAKKKLLAATATNGNVTYTTDSYPIEWNTLDVINNTSVSLEGVPFVKVSSLTPNKEQMTKMSIRTSDENMAIAYNFLKYNDLGVGDNVICAVYVCEGTLNGESYYNTITVISVLASGNYSGIEVPEAGIYVVNFGTVLTGNKDIVINYEN